MEFTFDITMSAERRRRLTIEAPQQVSEVVTLHLRPSENPIDKTKTTGAPTTAGDFIPTKKPVEKVKEAAAKDLTSVQGESNGSFIIYIAVGGVFLLALILAGGYYMRSKGSQEDVVEIPKEGELSVSAGTGYYGGAQPV